MVLFVITLTKLLTNKVRAQAFNFFLKGFSLVIIALDLPQSWIFLEENLTYCHQVKKLKKSKECIGRYTPFNFH